MGVIRLKSTNPEHQGPYVEVDEEHYNPAVHGKDIYKGELALEIDWEARAAAEAKAAAAGPMPPLVASDAEGEDAGKPAGWGAQ